MKDTITKKIFNEEPLTYDEYVELLNKLFNKKIKDLENG